MEKRVKWYYSGTQAGNPAGRRHYDISGGDGSNVALVYPSEDGDEPTLKKAGLIAASPELLEFAELLFEGLDTGMIRLDSDADETASILERGRKALDNAKMKRRYYLPPEMKEVTDG